MDPDTALKEARIAAARILALADALDDTDNPLTVAAIDLAEHVAALDTWIVNGGFLPRPWRPATLAPHLTPATLQGWPVVYASQLDTSLTVYLRLPATLRRPIEGPEPYCNCVYCQTHPDQRPTWDTLAVCFPIVPVDQDMQKIVGRNATWTVHAPEWDQSTFTRLGIVMGEPHRLRSVRS